MLSRYDVGEGALDNTQQKVDTYTTYLKMSG